MNFLNKMMMGMASAVLFAVATQASDIVVKDCDGKNRTLNQADAVTVIIYSNEDVQDRTREIGRMFDEFQGRKGFREIVIVDLRGSLGGIFRDITLSQMSRNLDKEAQRLIPFYRKNGNQENPRKDLIVIADFEGKLSQQVGWGEYKDDTVAVIVYNKKGQIEKSWNNVTTETQEIKTIVKRLLDSN